MFCDARQVWHDRHHGQKAPSRHIGSELSGAGGGLNIDNSRIPSDGSHKVNSRVVRCSKLTGDDRSGAALGMFQSGASFMPTNHDHRYPMNFIKGDRLPRHQLVKFLTLRSRD